MTTTSERPYGGESPTDRASRRRQALLDAGLELFGTVGYRATTLRALCRRARVTDRYFYESFTTMEDLLVAVYKECHERLWAAVVAAVAQADDDQAERVRAALDAFFSEAEDPRLARVTWLEILGVSTEIDQLYNNGLRMFAELIQEELLKDTADMDFEELSVVALALTGGVSQSAVAWLLRGYDTPRETVVAATSRVLLSTANSLTPGQVDEAR